MEATPLQYLLGFNALAHHSRLLVEGGLMIAAAVVAALLNRRRPTTRTSSLVMLSLGFLVDLIASPRGIQDMRWPQWAAAMAVVLVFWGLIKGLLDLADSAAHRSRAHFSTIFKDLLTILLFAIVMMGVLIEDIHIDPTPLLASSAVVAVVLGLALQESLGNVFSGLTLQVGKPFAPGDWVRSGNFVGRVQGISWRSTTVISRANEKLEIPNSMLAKDVVTNYSNGVVADEVAIGLTYDAPPNYVREVIADTLRSVPGVLQSPPPSIWVSEYGESGIKYRIKYWMSDYGALDHVRDSLMTSLWYVLKRKAIEIPYPIRTLRPLRQPIIAAGAASFEREIMNELRQVDFLRDLHDEELRLLLPGVTVLKFGAGEIIVREGDEGNSLYMIRAGTVEVIATASDGRPVHIRDLQRPAFFGEMALMTGEPRNATIRAQCDAELLELSRDGFTELFKLHPDTAAKMSEVIALRMTERRELLAATQESNGNLTPVGWLLAKMRSVFNLAAAAR